MAGFRKGCDYFTIGSKGHPRAQKDKRALMGLAGHPGLYLERQLVTPIEPIERMKSEEEEKTGKEGKE